MNNIVINGNTIKVSGQLDKSGADEVVAAMSPETVFTLDFAEVGNINFAALRSLLRCRQSGIQFSIINASSDVAERFEDTGVASFVNVTRKPKPLKLGTYDEFGGGFLSKSFNSDDGDSVMKVYGPRAPRWFATQEKNIAKAVMLFGIPTPLVGSLYEDEENTGLDFERIEGKRSLSRIISQEPERMREISVLFADMCKELHSKQCDTRVFPDRKISYRRAVLSCKDFNEEEKQKVMAFIDSVPDATTCLHGDMQPSNIITNGVDTLWIDLADFSYGNPMLDIGMWFFLSMLNPEHLCQHIFHMTKSQMAEMWDIFMEVYFDAKTPEQKTECINTVEPYAALHMLYLGANFRFEPGMIEYIKDKLLK